MRNVGRTRKRRAGKGERFGKGKTLELLKREEAPRERERGFERRPPAPHPAENSQHSPAQRLPGAAGGSHPELSAAAPAGIFSFSPCLPPEVLTDALSGRICRLQPRRG